MKSSCARWSLLAVVFVVASSSRGEDAKMKSLADAAKIVAKKMPSGCLVTAEKKGGAVAYALSGKSDVPDTPAEKIVFEIGSITKVFTSLLLAQAVVEGKTKLDATLGEIMGPEQKFVDPKMRAITLKQLATHTSGLPRMPAFMGMKPDAHDPYADYDQKMLVYFLEHTKLEGEPPFEMSYSNLGAAVLGEMVSRIFGKPWEVLIAEKITGPLGMKDTMPSPSPDMEKRLAPPFEGKEKAHSWHFLAFAPAGALRSTAADMMIFGEALLHPEKTPLHDAIKLMMQPHTNEGDIGLALMIDDIAEGTTYWHNGGTGGYRSLWEVTPAKESIRLVLSNNAAFAGEDVIGVVRDEKPRTKESGKVLTAEQLADYEGVYSLGKDARFTILRRGDQLWTQLTGQSFLHLFPHENDDRFFLKIVAAEIQFNRENGKVVSLTNFQNGRRTVARKTTDPVPKIKFRSAKELAPYTGSYELAPGAIITIEIRNATLFVKLTGQESAPVFEKRDDWFEYDVVKAALEFERDKDGRITALKLHQNGAIMRAPKKEK